MKDRDRNPTVVFPAPRTVTVEPRPLPPIGPEAVRIRTQCTLISNGTEGTILRGDFPPGSVWDGCARFPFEPGYDNVGVVADVGNAVDPALRGRRVATYGTHARYVTAPADALRFVPDAVADEDAVFFTLAEIVMNGIRRSGLQWGEAVAVYGLGMLGQLAVRFSRLCGARPVVAVDPVPERLERLPADPGILPVQPSREDLSAVIESATRGRRMDVAFEVTGKADLIPDEIRALHPQGRLVILGSPRGATPFDFHDLCNAPSITIIGAHNASHPPCATHATPWSNLRHAEMFFRLLADGEVDVRPLVTHREAYTNAPRLYDGLLTESGSALGMVLDWRGAPE